MRLPSQRFVRRRMISLAASLSFMATSFALAQDPKGHSHSRAESDAIEQHFLFENDSAISNMNRKMLARPTGDVDHDFVDTMIPHHQGAIDMARAELKYGHNSALRQLAQGIVDSQEREIAMMRHALTPSPDLGVAAHPAN
jgi:uncharacterized protein (DUF305 family)